MPPSLLLLDGSTWQVVLETDAFWHGLKLLRFIGVLSSVCKAFLLHVPVSRLAWGALASSGPARPPQQFLRQVFCLNRYEMSRLKPYQTTVSAMKLSFCKFRSPSGLCDARRRLLRVRTSDRN